MINWSNQPGQVFPNNQAGVGSQYDRPTPPAPMHVALAPAHVTPAGPVGPEAVKAQIHPNAGVTGAVGPEDLAFLKKLETEIEAKITALEPAGST